MQYLKYVMVYFLLLFAEKNLLPFISINGVVPDLIFILIIIISLQENKSKSTLIGFFAGLGQDIFSTHFFGLAALTKSIAGFWGVFFQQPKRKYTLSSYTLTVAILALVHDIIFGIIYNLGTHFGFGRLMFQFILPGTLYTLLFAVIAYLIFKPVLWKTERILD